MISGQLDAVYQKYRADFSGACLITRGGLYMLSNQDGPFWDMHREMRAALFDEFRAG